MPATSRLTGEAGTDTVAAAGGAEEAAAGRVRRMNHGPDAQVAERFGEGERVDDAAARIGGVGEKRDAKGHGRPFALPQPISGSSPKSPHRAAPAARGDVDPSARLEGADVGGDDAARAKRAITASASAGVTASR